MKLLNHGIGSKMSDMEQVYSHHHMVHVHHNGIIIGTIIGSCAVTLLAAIALVSARPGLALHPLNFTSQIGVQTEDTQSPQPGLAASSLTTALPQNQGSAGATSQALSQVVSH
jgi:hypothetical protein